jgi:predicted RNA binding protein YcfA (HicA-like mRNA interferase family)
MPKLSAAARSVASCQTTKKSGPGTLSGILKQAGVSVEEFIDQL